MRNVVCGPGMIFVIDINQQIAAQEHVDVVIDRVDSGEVFADLFASNKLECLSVLSEEISGLGLLAFK